jgi:hypothetical protein
VLVQWSGWPKELVTWESFEALHQAFPWAPAWGQAGTQAPGIVNTSTTPDHLEDEDNGPCSSSPDYLEEEVNGPRRSKRNVGPTGWSSAATGSSVPACTGTDKAL